MNIALLFLLLFAWLFVFSLLEYSSLYARSQREDKWTSYYYTGSLSVLKVSDQVFPLKFMAQEQ